MGQVLCIHCGSGTHTEVTACDQMPNLLTTRSPRTYFSIYKTLIFCMYVLGEDNRALDLLSGWHDSADNAYKLYELVSVSV